MTTIKIKSTDEASQGAFVIIDIANFNQDAHEPFDDEARAALSGAVAAGVIVPTMAELLAARDALQARERELDVERDRLAEQGAANDAEAERLRAAAAVATDPASMTAAQLRDALTAKGVTFPAAASKGDLQALLVAAA